LKPVRPLAAGRAWGEFVTRLDISATKEPASVTASGERLQRLIDGVAVRRTSIQEYEHGITSEIFSDAWNIDSAPVRHISQSMVRAGHVKGWVYHKLTVDRLTAICGSFKFVLWDIRPQSPTHGMVNEIFLSERNRGLLSIPTYVVHAVQNIGDTDATFVNLPTLPYNHADPDKYRIDDPASVPYPFDKGMAW